jgi:hypothetical protein
MKVREWRSRRKEEVLKAGERDEERGLRDRQEPAPTKKLEYARLEAWFSILWYPDCYRREGDGTCEAQLELVPSYRI